MTKKELIATEQQSLSAKETVIDETTIKNYFCKNATSSELALGAMICKQQGLNPFAGDVHFVKYGEQKMQVIVSKYAFLKRAERNPHYDGFKAWVEADGDDFVGKCEVYRKDRKVPIYCEVYYSEYNQKNKMWTEKPKTMIRKVAVVQALREAFPDELGGLYSEDEMPEEHNQVLVETFKAEDCIREINKCNTISELIDYFNANQKEFNGNQEIMSALSKRKSEIQEAER